MAREKGLSQVAALRGGWAGWQQSGYPQEGEEVAPSNDGEAAVLGSPDAPLTMLEFTDFQCSYCRQYALQTLPRIHKAYIDTGRVRYVVKDFPLPNHNNAQKAAEAAHCAGEQGAYWDMHYYLFQAQQQWAALAPEKAVDAFATYAQDLGLDGAAFASCLASDQFAGQVRQDLWEGQRAGIEGTPSFLIDGQVLAGALTFERFQVAIELALEGENSVEIR
jgi:protein-disulfide isomerase